MKDFGLIFMGCGAPFAAQAHGFGERYDLPLPLSWWVAGAVLTVLLTFIGTLCLRVPPRLRPSHKVHRLKPTVTAIGPAWMGQFFLALTLICALWGTSDPLMNLAPTMIWIVVWQGVSFAVVVFGNFWPRIDPFRHLHRWCLPTRQASAWPQALGMWPATVLLLIWSALEVVYPLATTPLKVGYALIGWTALSVWGMWMWGPAAWHAHVDFVSLYFEWMGRIAPQAPSTSLEHPHHKRGQVGFVIAMLSTVLFDGLHGGSGWLLFEKFMHQWISPQLEPNGYLVGCLGLIAVWLFMLWGYILIGRITAWTSGTGRDWAGPLVISLIPIAIAYNVAHNFSSMVIQGQSFVQLLSDPLGRQWNLLGTATWYPDIGLLDAQVTWYIALTSIVGGHMVSVVMAHRLAWRLSPHRLLQATLPLTCWMLALTALSLYILADPMVNAL